MNNFTSIPDSPFHSPVPIIPYCAGCDREWEPDPKRRLGQRFICPKNSTHVAALVKGDTGKLWLRIEAKILSYELFSLNILPNLLKNWPKLQTKRAFLVIIARLFILALALFISPFGIVGNIVGLLLGIFLLFDVLINATSIVFISRFPTHPLRTILTAIMYFAIVTTAYGVIYALLPNSFSTPKGPNVTLNRFDAVYFSFVTIATLGYGEVSPASDSWLPKLLAITELLVGLYTLVIVLATQVVWINAPPVIDEPPTYAVLFPERK